MTRTFHLTSIARILRPSYVNRRSKRRDHFSRRRSIDANDRSIRDERGGREKKFGCRKKRKKGREGRDWKEWKGRMERGKKDASSWFLRLVLSFLRDIPDNEKDRAELIKKLNSFSMLITATRCTTRVYLNVRLTVHCAPVLKGLGDVKVTRLIREREKFHDSFSIFQSWILI